MGDLMKSGGGGLMGLLHSQNGELTMPKPFEREIFLLIHTLQARRLSRG